MRLFLKNLGIAGLSKFIFRHLARHRLAWLCALFLRLHVQKIKGTAYGTDPIDILIIPKEGFVDDILSSFGNEGSFNIYRVYRSALKAIAAGILHPSLDDNNYVSYDREINATKIQYRDFLREIWIRLDHLHFFQAVMGGNFGYYAERELGAALEEIGRPFIALHKENLKSPGRVEFFSHIYRTRRGIFHGRKVFVYNDIEKKVQMEAGVVENGRIVVTGMPRLDRIHRWRMEHDVRSTETLSRNILFFSFWPKTGLPIVPRKIRSGVEGGYESLGRELDGLGWTRLLRDCHEAVIRLAKENPEITVFVKSKGRLRESSAMYEGLGPEKRYPENLKVIVGGDPFEQITGSKVICGFNTTGLLEGLAAGKKVVVPRFDEALDEKMQPYIIDLEDAVECAGSPHDLIDILKKHALSDDPPAVDLSPAAIRMLDKWVGNSDGRSGQRVCDALIKEINGKAFS